MLQTVQIAPIAVNVILNLYCFLFYYYFCAEEAEKDYWEKINADRVATYNSKREKKRGTEKVYMQTNRMKNNEIAVRNGHNVILNVYDSHS